MVSEVQGDNMGSRIDITGQKFGKLLAIEYAYTNKSKKAVWKCICECGKEHYATAKDLRSGNTKSCGCSKVERAKKMKYKDGRAKERLYKVWSGLIKRCENPNCNVFEYYGKRGISICEEWKEYANFKKWAYSNGYDENAPRGKCTIDRINNNGNYEPSNCRIVDMHIQGKNKRYFPEHHPRDKKTGRFLKVTNLPNR